MAYTRAKGQQFNQGDRLDAAHVNHMEDGIMSASESVDTLRSNYNSLRDRVSILEQESGSAQVTLTSDGNGNLTIGFNN